MTSPKRQLENKGIYIHGEGKLYASVKDEDRIELLDDDSLPTSITIDSSGVPVELLTNISNKAVKVLQTPTTSEGFLGETEIIGDPAITSDKYSEEEIVGQVAPYSDFSEAGISEVNINWIRNDFYIAQTDIQYGDLELERAAKAKINKVEKKQAAGTATIKRFQNRANLYGIQGLAIYGLFNNPFVGSALTPTSNTGTTPPTDLFNMTSADVYNNIASIITEIIGNSNGYIDTTTPFRLATSARMLGLLTQSVSGYQWDSVLTGLKKNYPNLKEVVIPECETTAGTQIYVRAVEILGEETARPVANLLLRTSRVVQGTTHSKQKFYGATGGTRIYYPFALAHMLNPT